jgi:hypothetical protein
MNQLLIDKVRNVCKLALLFMMVAGTSFAWLRSVAAQETTFDVVKQIVSPRALDALPRNDFFSTESLDDKAKLLSEELLLKALDSEAFYTLVGQFKPVSEGFWGGYFSVDSADLTEIEQVRAALRSWNVPGMFFADVLVYESLQHGQRYASAYVIHIPSLKNLIERESEFFARWGITVNTPPGEIMMTIERTRQPDDRWRGFGLVFGYPKYAIDFFVTAGMHQRTSGEFVERDFRQVATFAGRSGRFVSAVPKLSRPGPEDIALQRRAALFLTEYKRLRPQYTAPTKNPSGLLRDWMDDGHGKCHPDHLLAKLPAKTESELDAEIASWSTAEVRPPEVKFNHLYVVLSQADFDAVRTSDFLLNQFAASDQGFPKFLAVDGPCQSIYLRGRDTYIELFGPENKFGEPVGKIGVGWTVEKVGELDVLQGLLTKDSSDSFTRVLNQWDFDREGAAVNWYHSLFRKQSSTSGAVWWFSETHVDFMPALYPEKSSDGDRISRQDFLASRYDATRILKNFTNLTIHLPLEAARSLRSDLDQVGWRSEEFDSRTWILRGPDFRLMIIVQPEGANARLSSIGFETNPGFETQSQQSLGDEMEVSFDGKQSGWIVFK